MFRIKCGLRYINFIDKEKIHMKIGLLLFIWKKSEKFKFSEIDYPIFYLFFTQEKHNLLLNSIKIFLSYILVNKNCIREY